MTQELQVGMIGVAEDATPLLDALAAEPQARLVAIADTDAETATRAASTVGAAVYTDFRSLIVEEKLDALVIAAPHFEAQNPLKLAAGRSLPVFKKAPLARRFDEALRLTQSFESARTGECPLVVSRAWPSEPAMEQAARWLNDSGRPFLVQARVFSCLSDDLRWRGDSEQAGGGVLLQDGYETLDMIIHWLGMPAEVFMACGRASRPQSRYSYDTEDTAVLVLKYAEGAIATISCCWTSGPPSWELIVRASDGVLQIDRQRVAMLDHNGKTKCTPMERSPNVFTHPVRAFLDGLNGAKHRMKSLARDHLWTMAVLEAAYLSARTGEAESPAKWANVIMTREGTVPPGLATALQPPREQNTQESEKPDET